MVKSHVYIDESRNDFRYSQANFDRSLFVCVSDHNRYIDHIDLQFQDEELWCRTNI